MTINLSSMQPAQASNQSQPGWIQAQVTPLSLLSPLKPAATCVCGTVGTYTLCSDVMMVSGRRSEFRHISGRNVAQEWMPFAVVLPAGFQDVCMHTPCRSGNDVELQICPFVSPNSGFIKTKYLFLYYYELSNN